MDQSRMRSFLVCLLALSLFCLAFAGGLAGCGKTKIGVTPDENGEGEGEGDSPAGIAFVRDAYKLCITNEDGSGLRQLTDKPGCAYANPSFSPSGKKLAALKTEGDSMPSFVIIDVASGAETDYYRNSSVQVNWGASGVPWFGTISWASEDVLYLTTTDQGDDLYQVAKFTVSTHSIELVQRDAKNPAVSADGKKLAYIALPADWNEPAPFPWVTDDPGDLMVLDLAGGGTRTVFVHQGSGYEVTRNSSRGYVFNLDFSPDGEHMAVAVFDEPDSFIYYTKLDGEIVSLSASTGAAARVWNPSFSPDGSKFAYGLDNWTIGGLDGRHELTVNVVPSVRVGDTIHPNSLGQGRDPSWGPPGTGSGGGGGTGGGGTGTWSLQDSGTSVWLNGVSAVDSRTCWAVGNAGTILKTTDGGQTWKAQVSGTSADLMAVSAVDSRTCWAAGIEVVLKTTDGGQTWGAQNHGAGNAQFTGVSAVDGQTCWACAIVHDHAIIRTNTGGSSWTVTSQGDPVLNGISAVDSSVAYGAGVGMFDGSGISRTTDGGSDWSVFKLGKTVYSVCALDRKSCWAAGDGGMVYLTLNEGADWSSRNAGTSSTLWSVSANDASSAIAVGDGGVVVLTSDGGASWVALPSGTTADLMGVSTVSASSAWAVGKGGVILHYVK